MEVVGEIMTVITLKHNLVTLEAWPLIHLVIFLLQTDIMVEKLRKSLLLQDLVKQQVQHLPEQGTGEKMMVLETRLNLEIQLGL